MKTKICKKCGLEKEITQFSKNKSTNDKLNTQCKECVKNYSNDKLNKILNNMTLNIDKVVDLEKTHYLYLVILENENEKFCKIGITSKKDINDRFINEKNYKLNTCYHSIKTNGYTARAIESLLLEQVLDYSKHYYPRLQLNGKTECYNIEYISEIDKLFNKIYFYLEKNTFPLDINAYYEIAISSEQQNIEHSTILTYKKIEDEILKANIIIKEQEEKIKNYNLLLTDDIFIGISEKIKKYDSFTPESLVKCIKTNTRFLKEQLIIKGK
jgi:hypothetical protein